MSIFKGWIGEKTTQFGMWIKLDDNVYRRFHDVVLKTDNGTTQIDHIVVSMYGIFVIEIKNYSGWIYGDEEQPLWTQVLYGSKKRFQNPLHQNYKHTMELSRTVGVPHEKIHSIVFFIGESTFKTQMPPNVMDKGLSGYIISFRDAVFVGQELRTIEEKIRGLKENPVSSKREHVEGLTYRFKSDTICPKCGAELVRRTARQGQNAGQAFLGCSGFPKCRYTKRD
ncbi:MAG: nuclease-related domain-containing protein [Syntrophorhabdaceae bacterium]